ncbi:MAG: glycosyltransferase [Patescibacteria group bacterium]|nr:glycosyltransferase [Patescibacteria group bacterium]
MSNKYTCYINTKNYHNYAGIIFIISTIVYLFWLVANLNLTAWWVSMPFFLAQTFNFFSLSLSIYNHRKLTYRVNRPPIPQNPPPLAIVVPVYKEAKEIVKKTVKSLLHISYQGEIVILVSNDALDDEHKKSVIEAVKEIRSYWFEHCQKKSTALRRLYLRHSRPHRQAKAGNLNQCLQFLEKYAPHIDLLLVQDADEVAYPDIVKSIVGYFSDPEVAYVQTIKQSKVSSEDPFGNRDLMWYARTAVAKDSVNAMFSCGSGVIWRISALKKIGGFSTWNIVEDLTTSYNLLAAGFKGIYHYEALSYGLAPEDLANFIKQRGTWALDTMRIFFWDNPLVKKGLTLNQKLQFLETPIFYLNGLSNILLIFITSLCLFFSIWPTTASAQTHALYLLPSFIAMEAYFLLLAWNIPFNRIRQFWIGLAPCFVIASFKALIYGPNKKPAYVVTRKDNKYQNYINLVLPQIILLGIIGLGLIKTLISTPLYSEFDWATVFWGFFQASFMIQIIKVSMWNYTLDFNFSLSLRFVNKIKIFAQDKFKVMPIQQIKYLMPRFLIFLMAFWGRKNNIQ